MYDSREVSITVTFEVDAQAWPVLRDKDAERETGNESLQTTTLLNLVCSDLTCDGEHIATRYPKRWKVEAFHKSLKSISKVTHAHRHHTE